MKIQFLNVISLFMVLFGLRFVVLAQELVQLNIRILDEELAEPTPAMACIRSLNDYSVRIPPYGDEVKRVSTTKTFYRGVEFNTDRNWIGPVRSMQGKTKKKERTHAYGYRPSVPYWKAPVSYQISGNFSILLKPGFYRVNVSKGIEYIPVDTIFEVPSGNKALEIAFVLKRWINLPGLGWYSGDVHVHHPTTKSEHRKFLLEYAKSEDIHLVNVLEMGHHKNDQTFFRQEGFGKRFRSDDGDYWLVSGQEDPRSTFGHIVGLNIDHFIQDFSNYNYYDRVFRELHEHPGALVGYAHFAWNGCELPRGFPWYITTGEIDFVELLQFSQINTLDYYDYLNLGFRITAAAGSDVPWGSTIGEVRTCVYTGDNFNADNWFEGLKKGHTFVTNGPVLLLEADGNLPGSEITRSKGDTSQILIKAYSHPSIGVIEKVVVYQNDGLLIEKTNLEKAATVLLTLNHITDKSQWLAAAVYCENSAVAHTTPVYFVVDRQPTWSVEKAPGIIEKQMAAIHEIEMETLSEKPIDHGILARLKEAKQVYRDMLDILKHK